MTPGDVARVDQAMAATHVEVDRLIRTFNIGKTEVGREKSILDIGSMLLKDRSKDDLAAIAMVAIARLAETQGSV